MRRHDDAKTLTCPCTAIEADTVGEMLSASGCTSDANLARVALWSLADHMGLDVPNGVFDLRHYAGRTDQVKSTPNPKVKQDRPWKRPKPAKSHPWRGEGKPIPPTFTEVA